MKTNVLILIAGMLLAVVATGISQPIITSQPQNQTNVIGTTATFAVEATGAEPLAYQWQHALDLFNYVDRPEGTKSTLAITNVQPSDSGNYRVIVTNSLGAVTSAVARLTVVSPPTVQIAASAYTVGEGAGSVTVTVRRWGYLEPAVTVDYATADLTATNGLKYAATNGTLTFTAWQTNQYIVVPILNESAIEGTRTFRVFLSNPSGGAVLGTPVNATVNILDNDFPIKLSSSTYTVSEESGVVEIGVVRGDDGDYPVTVEFTTSDVTAVAGSDYVSVTNKTLRFESGERFKPVCIALLNDTIREPNKTFRVTLSHPTGGQLGSPSVATVTITDAEDETVKFEFDRYSVGEATDFFRVRVLRGENSTTATVDIQTWDISARTGLDYVGLTNTLTFEPGERLRLIAIPILNDGLKDPNEAFRLTLANLTGNGALVGSIATVTIVDNDPGVSLERSLYAVSEQERTLAVRVLRGNDMELGPFTVNLITSDLTAIHGVDYVALQTNLAFAQGEVAKSVAIEVLSDNLEEGDETFQLFLNDLMGAPSLGVSNAKVYLLDSTGLTPHEFGRLTLSNGIIQVALEGTAPQLFANDFDLYPIEVSTNLVDWTPWVTLQRTNAITNAFSWQDPVVASTPARFYRTPTNQFITPFPKPPGPFPVGLVSRLVTDSTRQARYASVPGEARFMVSVWYPAVVEGGKLPARLEDEMVTLIDGSWSSSFSRSRRYQFRSSAQPDVPCAAAGAPYPIYAYSPGGYCPRTDLVERGPYLASYGYVVVAADPMDAPVSVFPDGTVLTGFGLSFSDRVRDLQVILDELVRWSTDDPLFRGRLAVTNVAVGGWSYGAGVAAEVCRIDARCRAFLSFEGYFQDASTVLSTGLSIPMLSLYAEGLYDPTTGPVLHNKATRDSIWLQIKSAQHENFGDSYWALAPAGGTEAASIMNTYTLWFLNKYLKGSTDPVPALKDYPRVFNFVQK